MNESMNATLLFSFNFRNLKVILYFPLKHTFFKTYLGNSCMYSKDIAYNQDVHLFRKLSFGVLINQTKRDALVLATLRYMGTYGTQYVHPLGDGRNRS